MNRQLPNELTRRSFLGAAAAGTTATLGVAAEKPRPERLSYGCEAPVIGVYDVVVCGGGPAGCAAAISAARHGAKTLLIEKYGFLGGAPVAQLVSVVLSTNGVDFQGIWHEWAERLLACRAMAPVIRTPSRFYPGCAWFRTSLDSEGVKRVWDELLEESGAQTLLLAHLCGACVENGMVTGVLVHIHPPDGDPVPPRWYHSKSEAYGAFARRLAEGDWFDIPYGCLVAAGVDNLLVAGRCISAGYMAQGSLRIQQTCMATGQAAGAAAALSVRDDVTPRELGPQIVVGALAKDRDVPPAFSI